MKYKIKRVIDKTKITSPQNKRFLNFSFFSASFLMRFIIIAFSSSVNFLKVYSDFPFATLPGVSFFFFKRKSLLLFNPNYSYIFYYKTKLPAIIGNAQNLFSSKLGYNSFTKKLLRFPILLVF